MTDLTNVFESLKQDWLNFKHDAPGRRFQAGFDRRQKRRGRTWSPSRLAKLTLGIALMIGGPIVGMVPGPGGIIVFGAGLLLFGSEFRPIAKTLDWFEPKLHTAWTWLKRRWRKLPLAGKIVVVVIQLAMIAASSFLGYLFVSGWL